MRNFVPWLRSISSVRGLTRKAFLMVAPYSSGSTPSTILHGLNPSQAQAASSPANVLQILAPPGSGKTKTLTSRVAYLLSHPDTNLRCAPQNVICCTFTIKAAREMRERLRGMVGGEVESKLILGTFHSVCRRYLVRYGYLIGIQKYFGIADSNDSLSIVKRIIKKASMSIEPRTARGKISSHKAKGKSAEELDTKSKNPQKNLERQEFAVLFREYQDALERSNLLDYDDLLLRCVALLQAHPQCVSNIEALLIDEFQDTNVVQFELMKLLAQARKRVTIVGDPDQSIYGFRSAEVENLRKMRVTYPDTVVVNLEENYRSSAAILRLAQAVIDQDTNRPEKKLKATHGEGMKPVLRRLPNPHEEALWIVSEIKRMVNLTGGLIQHSDIAILIRSAYLSLLIEKAIGNAGIPYRMVGGMRFFDRVEIRIIVDYLRTISHPDNNSALLEIINVPARKIGETTVKELLRVGEENKVSVWKVIQKVLKGELKLEKKLSSRAEKGLQEVVTLLKKARSKMDAMEPEQAPSKLIEYVVSAIKLQDYLKAKHKEDHEDRWENVKELSLQATDVSLLMAELDPPLPEAEALPSEVKHDSHEMLARFLANISLSTDTEEDANQAKGRVTISTIHSAKGLEWPVVFVPAVYEGSIPHSRAEDTDEERRLLYVAMTRAKALLNLTFPVIQAREDSESILTQFLPANVGPHLASTAPNISDSNVSTLARILGCAMPSQEELTKGLENLQTGESASDDVWPEDGTRRGYNSTQFAYGEYPYTLTSGQIWPGSTTWPDQRSNYSTLAPSNSTTIPHGVTTTMTTMIDPGSYSASATSMSGFTFASTRLQTLQAEQTVQEKSSTAKRPIISKSSSNQGNLTTFFSQGRIKARNDPPQSDNTVPLDEPKLPQIPANPIPTIPSDLATHRLDNHRLNTKRPSRELEEVSPNAQRKRYVFLSSSSPPPSPPRSKTADENSSSKDHPSMIRIPGKTSLQGTMYQPTTTQNFRPAVTFHTTSMTALYQGSSVSVGRKTLGVKRALGGWEGRKHK